jgi:hypothetical protein
MEDRWTFGARVLANQIRRARLRTTLTYQAHPRLSLGLEYNPLADSVSPLANALVRTETERLPAVMLGTSSDRIGTPHGQSFYLTASKNVEQWVRLPLSPYAGVAFGTYDDEWVPIAGGELRLPKGFSLNGIFDGHHGHGLLNYSRGRHVISLVMVRWKHPGLSYSISF